jgi:hypothetical protein
MIKFRPVPTTAFVDWNSQIHNASPPSSTPFAVAERTLTYVGRTLSRTLAIVDPSRRFEVSLRIYHGWHKGFEPTERRKALLTAAARMDFSSLSICSNVVIRADIAFGDRLISGLDSRLHRKLNIHLPDTLRERQRKDDKFEEKMVDTAIAVDVVDLAHREPDQWLVILAEDDDLVPPTLAAESIINGRQGKVLLLRKRTAGPCLRLEGVLQIT